MNNGQFGLRANDLSEQVTTLDDFVVIGVKDGKPWIASTKTERETQHFVGQYAGDLLPQTA